MVLGGGSTYCVCFDFRSVTMSTHVLISFIIVSLCLWQSCFAWGCRERGDFCDELKIVQDLSMSMVAYISVGVTQGKS